jgi:hypothetical protein
MWWNLKFILRESCSVSFKLEINVTLAPAELWHALIEFGFPFLQKKIKKIVTLAELRHALVEFGFPFLHTICICHVHVYCMCMCICGMVLSPGRVCI